MLIKADGLPTYNFANVIDDHTMGITHVMRGTEYLSSAPKYNLLYEAFGWEKPIYVHCPPVMKDAQNKLSKRNGDASYQDLVAKGYLPAAVLNYLLLLGWAPEGEQEIFSLDEMIKIWDPSRISKSPAIFDPLKLRAINAAYIRALPAEEFRRLADPFIDSAVHCDIDRDLLCANLQPRCEVLEDIPPQLDFFDAVLPIDAEMYRNKKQKTTPESAKEALTALLPVLEAQTDWTRDAIFEACKTLAEQMEKKNGWLLFPLGIALSGKARTPEELRADILKAASYIPGTHRLNLHEIYGEFGGETVDRDQVEPRHFQGWIEWAKEHGMKLDFNSTSFSHPKSGDLSLANPDPGIRDFWVEHTKRCRAIAEEMGKAQGDPSIMNLWVHDGSKDLTVNRMLYRELLRDSLDRIFETEYDHMKDSIESKVFGIGLESYTVGSNDFYIGYGASRGKIVTLDTGHFHPTEIVADKISSLLLFIPEVMLHVSRPVRWDSDHVTIMNDDTLELCKEIVRCDALDRVHIGLDYFDASINRIGAYVIGSRATQKCLMQALLEPLAQLRRYEAAGQGFERLALLEESKSLPWNAVWDMFCLRNDVPVGEEFIAGIQQYEREVTSKR